MIYAPVIIPTLNRRAHIEKLLKSLEENSWAKYTEVYISIDFPPADKYREGYIEVCSFLDNYKCCCLKKIIVIKQDENLGPHDNINFLMNYVSEIAGYDRYIFTEDDNIFAPNFLEYIDKGLDLFGNEEDVMAVCGFHDLGNNFNNKIGLHDNVVKQLYHVPYGFGILKAKNDLFEAEKEDVLLSHKFDNISSIWKLFKCNQLMFVQYIQSILCGNRLPEWKNGELLSTDSIRSIYNYFTGKYTIVPIEYKSHTNGYDGSGLNMPSLNINPDEKWPLDNEKSFNFKVEKPFKARKDVKKILNNNNKCNYKTIIKTWVLYFIYLFCGKDKQKVLKICGNSR